MKRDIPKFRLTDTIAAEILRIDHRGILGQINCCPELLPYTGLHMSIPMYCFFKFLHYNPSLLYSA